MIQITENNIAVGDRVEFFRHQRFAYVLEHKVAAKHNRYLTRFDDGCERWVSQSQIGVAPTSTEIRLMCEQFQSEWSESDRFNRLGLTYEDVRGGVYTIPTTTADPALIEELEER